MARPIDVDFLNQLRILLKKEWMINGQQQFKKTLDQLAMELTGLPKEKIKSSLKNKIFNYLDMLERGGSIKIDRGEGSNPNKFIYIDDKMVNDSIDIKSECDKRIDEFAKDANAVIQMGIDINKKISDKLVAAIGEVNFYKQAILTLEPWGTTPDGNVMFRIKKGSELPSIIEQLKRELGEKV